MLKLVMAACQAGAAIGSVHPRVKSLASNHIEIEVNSNNDYLGPLYIGSRFYFEQMVYDTASVWTAVTTAGTYNDQLGSEYTTSSSKTSEPMWEKRYDQLQG